MKIFTFFLLKSSLIYNRKFYCIFKNASLGSKEITSIRELMEQIDVQMDFMEEEKNDKVVTGFDVQQSEDKNKIEILQLPQFKDDASFFKINKDENNSSTKPETSNQDYLVQYPLTDKTTEIMLSDTQCTGENNFLHDFDNEIENYKNSKLPDTKVNKVDDTKSDGINCCLETNGHENTDTPTSTDTVLYEISVFDIYYASCSIDINLIIPNIMYPNEKYLNHYKISLTSFEEWNIYRDLFINKITKNICLIKDKEFEEIFDKNNYPRQIFVLFVDNLMNERLFQIYKIAAGLKKISCKKNIVHLINILFIYESIIQPVRNIISSFDLPVVQIFFWQFERIYDCLRFLKIYGSNLHMNQQYKQEFESFNENNFLKLYIDEKKINLQKIHNILTKSFGEKRLIMTDKIDICFSFFNEYFKRLDEKIKIINFNINEMQKKLQEYGINSLIYSEKFINQIILIIHKKETLEEIEYNQNFLNLKRVIHFFIIAKILYWFESKYLLKISNFSSKHMFLLKKRNFKTKVFKKKMSLKCNSSCLQVKNDFDNYAIKLSFYEYCLDFFMHLREKHFLIEQ